ncbi:MAG: polysaccharide biosynthesis C-terminal domain-containing protein, partial [Cetobacterium sp.]
MLVPKILIQPFIKNDPQLMKLTLSSTKIFFSMVFIMGFHMIGSSYFQAIGKAKITTILNIIRQFVLTLPLLYILPKYYGLNGVWLANPVTDLSLAIITSYFVIKELHDLKIKSTYELNYSRV